MSDNDCFQAGDIYVETYDDEEHYMLLSRRTDNSWWMMNLDHPENLGAWENESCLLDTNFYMRVA